MSRVILHSDLNNFYASVECLYHPELRKKPVAVAGDKEQRNGIVLAKNDKAKKFGVATGNPLWLAKQRCPDIVFVPPHYDLYLEHSRLVKNIYYEYTDQIESYGIDECWLDVTRSRRGGKEIADEIRHRISSEIGITASVGVSFNKVFAKLGSDYKKPDATTVIGEEDFRQLVWPLPVGALLFVGRATAVKLRKYGIYTIGELAQTDCTFLERRFGKNGRMLWLFANGLDRSPVAAFDAEPVIKSIGNSTTTPRDLVTDEDVKIPLRILSESVSSRLRERNLICRTVQLGIRTTDLVWMERQAKLAEPNRTAKAIFELAFALYQKNHRPGSRVRSLSVRACDLFLKPEYEQLTLFGETEVQKQEKLEAAVDCLRGRYGYFSLRQGRMFVDEQLSDLNPKEDHIIHPEGFQFS